MTDNFEKDINVPSKEQIIIDGVDVSECIYLPYCEDRQGNCGNNPNCYFKQLARKKQEYEELRQYHNKCCKEFENEKQALLGKYNQILNGFYNGDYCNTEHCSLLKAKEQECEELKKTVLTKCPNCNSEYLTPKGIELYKENQNLKQECEELKEKYEEIKEDRYNLNMEMYTLDRYRKALEEIEEYAKNFSEVDLFKDIKDIINKVKDSE